MGFLKIGQVNLGAIPSRTSYSNVRRCFQWMLDRDVMAIAVQEHWNFLWRTRTRDFLKSNNSDWNSKYYKSSWNPLHPGSGLETFHLGPISNKNSSFHKWAGSPKGFSVTRINSSGRAINIYNVHSPTDNGPIEDAAILQLIDHYNSDPLPLKIVLGDFNAKLHHRQIKNLLTYTNLDLPGFNEYIDFCFTSPQFDFVSEEIKGFNFETGTVTQNHKDNWADHPIIVTKLQF